MKTKTLSREQVALEKFRVRVRLKVDYVSGGLQDSEKAVEAIDKEKAEPQDANENTKL